MTPVPTTGTTPMSPLPPRRPSKKPKKKKRRTHWLLKSFFTVFMIVVLGALGYAGYLYMQIDKAIHNVGTDATVAPPQSAKKKPLTILLLGTDTRAETGSLNTDVIMVASLNPESRSASLVSIPRDTRIAMNGVKTNKANAFYANYMAADKKTADAKTKDLFGKFLGVKIDYVAKLDFQGFEEVVDKFGGLTINVDMDMCYRDNFDGTNIRLKKGEQHLNGQKTLDFVRYRKSNCGTAESNDLERNERQQQVIDKLADKMKSIEGVLKLGQVIETLGNHMKTDIPSAQIKTFLGTYIGIDRDKINYVHLEGDWQSPYVILTNDSIQAAQAALRTTLATGS
ncbi:LCP family protein [Paenibacillus koleovorans]|uniref:LCP family protein n=1 Tax=Paenibacillus koleovorans TaxID=121608 RepID=UPI001FE96A8D|nr:LCP family protein [Paenibacillus koleovorans]